MPYSLTSHRIPLRELPLPRPLLRQKALYWAQQYRQVALFEGLAQSYPHGQFRHLLGVSHEPPAAPALSDPFAWLQEQLQVQKAPGPLLGYLTYDLKNHLEELHSHHPDGLQWPELHFFRPQVWLEWQEEELIFCSSTPTLSAEQAWQQVLAQSLPEPEAQPEPVALQPRTNHEQYLHDVQQVRQHIEEGDVYELNYCQEFYAEGVQLQPAQTYLRLTELSPMPFSGFLKLDHLYLLCASPERYVKLQGQRALSQPIKGTAPRGLTLDEDLQQKQALLASEKERAENMMIVDLVRNDLSRCCRIGSVRVEELFGIYSFPFVHQMISTISGELRPQAGLPELLRASFPMGSMTGAPKVRAMELIEQYEKVKRGLFSGSIGYILPTGEADLNVVIRSLQYNSRTGYLSYSVGSAITYDSVPEQEYEECLLKAAALMRALG